MYIVVLISFRWYEGDWFLVTGDDNDNSSITVKFCKE